MPVVAPTALFLVVLTVQLHCQSLVPFVLEDQWGRQWSAEQLQGRVVVLLLADREGAEQSAVWGRELGKQFGSEVLIIGCANLEGVPFFLRWLVRARIKESLPHAPLLLDWDGTLFRAYRCRAQIPTVLVFDMHGQLRHRYEGAPTVHALEHVVTRIRSLQLVQAP
ncbi:MAG: hypothetical protein RML15_02980 [Bacteroidota bacterium]|nr:hypothetical protein [Bacteroidota bacterium]